MSEKDSPRELSSEESQRFSEQIAELGLEDKLITSEQLYRERTAVFYES